MSADAATPPSGTVTDTAPTITWSAGPFAVPNVSGTTGTPTCGDAQLCDDYALTVSVPTGYDADHSLRIDIKWPNAAADFDLYVLDANGREVAASASSSDPETLLLPAVTASYTVRVVPYAPLGESFSGTASLVANPVDPPPSKATPPTYSNSSAPDSIADAHDAGEPSIGVNRATGAVMFQAYTSTLKVTYDTADAATWRDKSANAGNGCPQGSVTSLDPILFTDPATNRTFESQLAGKTALTCYTDDDGETWTPTAGSGINSGVDHQTIGGGPFAPGGPGALTSYPNAVYYCSQDIADASCAISRDGGLTYGPAVPMYSLLDCGGLHGHVKVAPDGTVYVPNKGCGGNQAVAVSEDNGLSWSVRRNPFSSPGDSDPSVGIGASGTVYMGYQNSDGTARIAVSHDKGKTWLYDQRIGGALGIRNIVFPVVTAGDDNRAAFAFLGTTTGGNYQDTESFTGVWHLYVATTYDGGQSWVTVDATPTDPVQKGSICTGGTTCGKDRNLLDFNDVTIDAQGRVLVAYADGCTGVCATGGAQNYDALATIARQSSGNTLYGAYDAVVGGKHKEPRPKGEQ
ncbi:sialidase family protein [Streptomyces sp. TRM68367]|uniref:sialidase family protein n=1 Tax=Streptomyces sp. TRM68367 TaxID=2758415 RepID=UPI00165ABD7B|nr:sialidase family protein [Streptomyces sp. TRM68367]MBC9731086.1 exo-alpha-sialidase [Streptomyces sp. TRM68367]